MPLCRAFPFKGITQVPCPYKMCTTQFTHKCAQLDVGTLTKKPKKNVVKTCQSVWPLLAKTRPVPILWKQTA